MAAERPVPSAPGAEPPADPLVDPSDGRTRHYGGFYGLDALPEGDAPFVVVSGNCQAESLRILLGDVGVRSVRVPPVFELTGPELPLLHALLARADAFVTQPVRAGYRDLALGTDELAEHLPPGARVVRYPAFRFAGLHPWQVIVRAPGAGDPPGVPYLDLRTVVEVATGARPTAPMPADGIRAVAAASAGMLREREEAGGLVPVSDLLLPARGDECHVINHPGNRVLVELARRVQTTLGLEPTAADPGRVLLSEVVAPVLPEVVDALGLDIAPTTHWTYRGELLDDEQVRAVQLPWLRAHPQVLDRSLAVHHDTLEALGW